MKTEKRMIDANALSESIKEGSGTSLQTLTMIPALYADIRRH